VKKVVTFLKEAREELGKVSWPTRHEVSRFTFVTIVTVVIIAVFMWVIDTALMQVVKMLMR
jgi:preprotein translocase subunit SecE